MKKLFAIWAEWSVFPAMYLIGLQATFYFSESERSAMKTYIAEKIQDDELDGISILSDPSSAENEVLDALRKRAKTNGIFYTDKTNKYELQYRLEYGDRFSQARYGQSAVSSISTLLTPFEQPSDAHISSNTPLALNPYAASSGAFYNAEKESTLTSLELLLQQQQGEGSGEYDDDIDGVPMDIGVYTIPVSSQLPPNVAK